MRRITKCDRTPGPNEPWLSTMFDFPSASKESGWLAGACCDAATTSLQFHD